MSIRIINSEFSNNGTGIKATGKVDLEIRGSKFKGNGKDIDLLVEETSNITIASIVAMDCKTESITLETYSGVINEAKQLLESQETLSDEQASRLNSMLDELHHSKDDPSKIKKILTNIYDVKKSAASGLLVAYLKLKFGW